jgi:hypothetical protein
MPERSSLFPTRRAAGDAVKADGRTTEFEAKRTEDRDSHPLALTLDDLGGRSDALGG